MSKTWSAVVRGTVLSEEHGSEWIRYRIKVERIFKGSHVHFRSFYTGNDSGRINLNVGSTYVLFARLLERRFVIGCDEDSLSASTKTAAVSEEIQRLLATKPTTSATIEGQVVAAGDFSKPLSGVLVTARRSNGIHRVRSDGQGLFSMQVPPGRYRVDVDPAVAEQTIYNLGYTHPRSVDLAPGQCAQLQYQGVRR